MKNDGMNKHKRYRQKLLQRRDDADRLEAGIRILLERKKYSLEQIRWAMAYLLAEGRLEDVTWLEQPVQAVAK